MRRHLGLGPGDEGPYTEQQWAELHHYAHGLDRREQERDAALARFLGGLSGGQQP
jgi:hypothetical protein